MSDERIFSGRINDLAQRAQARGCHTYSEFLTLSEQDDVSKMKFDAELSFFGGFDGAERRIACFRGEGCVYDETPPVVCVKVAPVAQKFADDLTHRDFLGSLMGLGIRREVLGDIILHENRGYVFCLDSVAEHICAEMKKVRHTDVKCAVVDEPPTDAVALPEITRTVVQSERLDAIVAAVFKLSRGASQELIELERVFVNGKPVTSATYTPKQGQIISVRGSGRFIYEGVGGETRKGRLGIQVRVYR